MPTYFEDMTIGTKDQNWFHVGMILIIINSMLNKKYPFILVDKK